MRRSLLVASFVLWSASPALAASLSAISDFGSNPGGLRMYAYVPDGMPAKAPLVVAMHGCTQNAQGYVPAGWNELADLWKFYVVYPEESSGMGCFRWYDASQTARGQGEAASVKAMVDYMAARHGVDASRVFVTGLSAGGAMTAVMLAAYPDVFAAGAPMAGIPYRCADSIGGSGTCMGSGKQQAAKTWGELVRAAYPGWSGPWPRVSIWQGSQDYTVSTKNSGELMKQWTDVNGVDQTANATAKVEKATHAEYRDGAGRTLVETWLVDGMGHGTAVEPGFEAAGGCGRAGTFVLSAGICSTYYAAKFFGLEPGEATPPVAPPDAGTHPPASGPDAGPGAPPPSGHETSCHDWFASNCDQVLAGRAVLCGAYSTSTCAKDSGDELGLYGVATYSWVRQVDGGAYEAGRCSDLAPEQQAGGCSTAAGGPALWLAPLALLWALRGLRGTARAGR